MRVSACKNSARYRETHLSSAIACAHVWWPAHHYSCFLHLLISGQPLCKPLLQLRYAARAGYAFSPLAVDLINQNKMRVNNQFRVPSTTVAAFIPAARPICWLNNQSVRPVQ